MLIKLKEREKFRFNLFFGKILKEEYDVNKNYKILRQCTKNQFSKIYSLNLSLTHNLLTYYPEYSFYPFPSCEPKPELLFYTPVFISCVILFMRAVKKGSPASFILIFSQAYITVV